MNNLNRFEEAKQMMLNNLVLAQSYVDKFGLSAISNEFRLLHQTLQREKFEVMVVGEFSNGKSTFINALMHNIVLPSSNVPTTAFINKISYAETPKYEVHFTNGKKQQLDYEEFLAYVSEDKQKFDQIKESFVQKLAPLAKQASHLQVGYPSEICQNNIVIIDSPGTNDMDERRVQITNEYIPKSDAAIFVLNAKKIFSASERAFLQRIMDSDIQKIFFVINFKDAIKTEEDFVEIEKAVLENLPLDLLHPKVHFISALHALQHYVPPIESNNPRARRRQTSRLPLGQTGMPELEQALFTFLTEDRGKAKLAKPLQRSEKLLRQVINEHIQFEIQSLSQTINNIEQHVQDIRKKLLMAEKNITSDAKQFHRQIENESREIVVWYKKQIANISSVAKQSLQKGLENGTDPEVIKTNIDLATGHLEKKLQQQLMQKANIMTKTLFENVAGKLHEDISNSTNRLFNLQNMKPEWGDVIIKSSNSSDSNATDMAIGGALVGGALLFLSGGMLGWGLLGAGAGAAAVGAYANSKQSNSSEQLRKQVNARYEKGLTTQAKEVEKGFEQLANQLRNHYEAYTHTLIETERNRADKLLTNQKMSTIEKQQQIDSLEKQKKIGESLIYQFNKTFNEYCQKEGVSSYV